MCSVLLLKAWRKAEAVVVVALRRSSGLATQHQQANQPQYDRPGARLGGGSELEREVPGGDRAAAHAVAGLAPWSSGAG